MPAGETVDPYAPAELGPVRLRNRIIKSATFEGVMPDSLVTDELIGFHRRVAEGGAGMTTVAFLAASPEGRTHAEAVWVRRDAVPGLARLADVVHDAGAAVSAQLGHAGPVANPRSNGAKSLAPSKAFNPLAIRRIPAATEDDLVRITADFGRSAALVAEAGFDAVEIHLGHNALLSSVPSPRFTQREDQWGGSLENRARFPRGVVDAVRAAVGDRLAVTAKLNMDDALPGGLKLDESLEFAAMLEADGTIDALELTGGSSFGNPMYLFRGPAPRDDFATTLPLHARIGFKLAGEKLMPDYPWEEAYFRDDARRYLQALDLPIILLGGINRPDTVQGALDEGFSFVAMARALLREPDLVERWARGETAEATCIHCNRCMPTIYSGTRCVLDHPEPIEVAAAG
jgi:2,4-dienoyl-CoA reductase-like NADH-dependent reductase (Old Yellow Enzyme family)